MSTKKSKGAILEKVLKMLELARNSSAAEQEAANALAAARRLMLEHGISEASLGAAKKKQGSIDPKNVFRPEGSAKFQPWEITLAAIVGEFFGARVLFLTSRERISFYGFGSDGEISEYSYMIVLKKIWDLALQHVRDHQVEMKKHGFSDMRRLPAGYTLKEVRTSYIVGILHTLSRRLQEERAKDTSEETAIVLSRSSAVDEYLDQNVPHGESENSSPNVSNYDSFFQGVKDGNDVQFVEGITAKQPEGALNG